MKAYDPEPNTRGIESSEDRLAELARRYKEIVDEAQIITGLRDHGVLSVLLKTYSEGPTEGWITQ